MNAKNADPKKPAKNALIRSVLNEILDGTITPFTRDTRKLQLELVLDALGGDDDFRKKAFEAFDSQVEEFQAKPREYLASLNRPAVAIA